MGDTGPQAARPGLLRLKPQAPQAGLGPQAGLHPYRKNSADSPPADLLRGHSPCGLALAKGQGEASVGSAFRDCLVSLLP